MTIAYRHGAGGPGTCEMLVDYRTDKPNPTCPEDFDIDVLCGKPANWGANGLADMCDDCRGELVADDPEIASDIVKIDGGRS